MTGLVAEVRGFLAALRGELPELFVPRLPPSPPRRKERRGADDDRALSRGSAASEAVRAAAAPFAARAAFYAPAMGVAFGRVRAKRMTSLWGSCSAGGDLSFNAALLQAPPEVLDYVVVHELAHRAHRGHGPRFWSLVERHCPAQRARRRWLRLNGAALLGRELPGAGPVDGEDAQAPAAVEEGVARQGEVEAAGAAVGASRV